ncbi:hypothetical protein MYA98_12090 [Salmonella sp. WGH-01]|nr:hypothetical protein MYA98_12090 [Salmonella sp. WGH-01]
MSSEWLSGEAGREGSLCSMMVFQWGIMSLLKHEQWLILGEDESHRIPPDALLGLPPQGKAWIRKEHDEDMSRLTSHIQGALGNTYRGVCHPQRIGHRACPAIHLENLRGKSWIY